MNAYAVTAQFYDAMAGAAHADVDLAIANAIRGVETQGLPIVDIGAGTGLTTQAVAKALPETEILAIEPDPAMRAALLTRVLSDPDLRHRVTILPCDLLSSPLPAQIAGAVAGASLVHFAPSQRRALWALLADRLSSNGLAVLEVQCPAAETIEEQRVATAQVGKVVYECWAAAWRIDDQRQGWRVRYVSRLSDLELDRQEAEYQCWVASPDRLMAEVQVVGLEGSLSGDLLLLRHKCRLRSGACSLR